MEKPSCILSQEFVNKLADFLCSEISENHKFKTKLSVIDVNTFFVIKGSTQSKTVQTLSELVDKFIEKYQKEYSDLTSVNVKTLDILEYGSKDEVFSNDSFNFKYSESKPLDYPTISLSSQFPYGYSNNHLKSIHSYLTEISITSKPYFKFNNVSIGYEIDGNNIELTSLESDSYYPDLKLLSILKDNFDGVMVFPENLDLTVI